MLSEGVETMGNIRPNDPVPDHAWFNALLRDARANRVRAGEGMQMKRGALTLIEARPIWAKLSGSGNPYGFREAVPNAAGGFDLVTGGLTDGSGAQPAYEVNAVAGLADKYRRLIPSPATDDWRFEDVRVGEDDSCTLTLRSCFSVATPAGLDFVIDQGGPYGYRYGYGYTSPYATELYRGVTGPDGVTAIPCSLSPSLTAGATITITSGTDYPAPRWSPTAFLIKGAGGNLIATFGGATGYICCGVCPFPVSNHFSIEHVDFFGDVTFDVTYGPLPSHPLLNGYSGGTGGFSGVSVETQCPIPPGYGCTPLEGDTRLTVVNCGDGSAPVTFDQAIWAPISGGGGGVTICEFFGWNYWTEDMPI